MATRPLTVEDKALNGVLPNTRWCFQLVLDYGDHQATDLPDALPDQAWPARLDPFSSSRNGFEVRTWRLCRRFLAFHDFPELGIKPVLVEVLKLQHDEAPAGATLRDIIRIGWRHDAGVSTSKAVPSLKVTYAPALTETAFSDALPNLKRMSPRA